MRKHFVRFTALVLFALPVGLPHAFGVSKEMVQLQTQVQQLQDMVQHLQTSNDERMGVIVNLVQQNTDNVNRMMAAVNALQSTLKAENDQRGSSNTQISSQIQSLNDSVDELKTRIANLTAQVQSIQGQLQNARWRTSTGGWRDAGKPGPRRPGGGTAVGARDPGCASRRPALSEWSA
jgi:outer membrane murein-binding lipoprotein Lpp